MFLLNTTVSPFKRQENTLTFSLKGSPLCLNLNPQRKYVLLLWEVVFHVLIGLTAAYMDLAAWTAWERNLNWKVTVHNGHSGCRLAWSCDPMSWLPFQTLLPSAFYTNHSQGSEEERACWLQLKLTQGTSRKKMGVIKTESMEYFT